VLISIIYSFVWPKEAASESIGFRRFVIRWGHAVTWGLLAINFLMRGIDPDLNVVASVFAITAGLMYGLFLLVVFWVEK